MTYGIELRDDFDNPVWNSYTVAGGVVADIRTFQPNASGGMFTYPAYVGRSVTVLSLLGRNTAALGVTADTALGYPRVTVSSTSYLRKIMVVVR